MHLAKSLILLGLLASSVFATSSNTYQGSGLIRKSGQADVEYRFRLTFLSPDDAGALDENPRSEIGAVLGVARILLTVGSERKDLPFYITRYRGEGEALVGFYFVDGFPHVLRLANWSSPVAEFQVYDSMNDPGAVLKGVARRRK